MAVLDPLRVVCQPLLSPFKAYPKSISPCSMLRQAKETLFLSKYASFAYLTFRTTPSDSKAELEVRISAIMPKTEIPPLW